MIVDHTIEHSEVFDFSCDALIACVDQFVRLGTLRKEYITGMYGGKFLPMHTGHKFCLEMAARQGDKVYCILFWGGKQENEILDELHQPPELQVHKREEIIENLCLKYPNVEFLSIDVTDCKLKNGDEDWDAETPLVLNAIGRMDAVYSSEISYGEYFKRAYPWAIHVLVDPPRYTYNISSTKIRNMDTQSEKNSWTIGG